MKTKFFAALILILPMAFMLDIGVSNAATADISCTNINDINAIECTDTTTNTVLPNELLRGLASDLDGIDQCKATVTAGGQSCKVGYLTCTIDSTASVYSATCVVDGLNTNIFQINCASIDTNNNNASCTVVNEIAAMAVDETVATQLSPPELVYTKTLVSACSNNFLISPQMKQDCATVLALLDIAADNTNPQAAQAAAKAADLLEILTPSAASAAIDASQTSLRAQNRNISQRMNQLRRAGLGQKEELVSSGLQFLSHGQPIKLADYYPELKAATGGGASADSAGGGRLGVFINGTVDMGDKDNSANERGFSFSGADLTAGVDYVTSDASFMGMAFGLSNSSADLNDDMGSLDNSGFNLILYASILPMPNVYIDANMVIGGNIFDQKRNMRYTDTTGPVPVNIDQTASATYFGDQFASSITGGMDYVRGSMTISPYATLQVLKSNTENYSETVSDNTASGAGFALQIDEQEYKSTSLTIGGQFSYAVNLSKGVFVPQAKLEWVKEFEDDINVVKGNFLGDPLKQKFRLPTDKPDDSYMVLGLGGSGIVPGGTTYYIFYQTYLGYENLSQSSINLGMRWEL